MNLESAKDKLSLAYIKKIAEKNYWKLFLPDYIQSLPFQKDKFEISLDKIPSGYKELVALKKNIEILKNISNTEKFFSIEDHIITTRESNSQTVPRKIIFETEEKFLEFLEKQKEAFRARENFQDITKNLPDLKDWILVNLRLLVEIEDKSDWKDIIKVIRYFLEEHTPNLYYLRELPVEVDSKFFENNESYLKKILNYILPEDKINTKANSFAERYYCKLGEEFVHIKILDENLKAKYQIPFTEFSIPLSEFQKLKFENINIIISENKTSIHLFQADFSFPSTIVIFGSGFGVLKIMEEKDNERKPIDWLFQNSIYYWGDMDTAGFEILSKFRKTYLNTKSIFMDKQTFTSFEKFSVNPKKSSKDSILKFLSEPEYELYLFLKEKNLRLEQEKLTHEYIKQGLAKILLGN